jgi:hypothetical protein
MIKDPSAPARTPLTWKEYQEDKAAHPHLGPHNAH